MPTPRTTAVDDQAAPVPATTKREADAVLARATKALEQVGDLKEEIGGFVKGMTRRVEKLEASSMTVEGIADAVHETMRPIVESANANMAQITTRISELQERPDMLEVDRCAEANPLRFSLDDEQIGRIIERARALVVADLGGGYGVDPVPSVHGKVLELMREVRELGKDGQADQSMGGYSFRSIDAAISAIGTAMRTVGLTLETSVRSRDYVSEEGHNSSGRRILWTSCRLVMRYAFVDPTDGSKHLFEMPGEARATDDKATSKSLSMALKYGLIQALMIPVAGTADGDGQSPQVFREGPAESPAPPADPTPAQQQFTQAEKARRALEALRQVHLKPAGEQIAECARIRQKIESEGLATVEIDGATLRGHGAATAATLRGGEPGTGF